MPPRVDWAAHAYQRTFLLQHGFELWNNFWYAGRYSFVTYSLIYYPLAALLGIKVLALASIASAAAAFSVVVFREWGPVSVVSSRSFAVLWVGIIGAAAFPFALAMSFALLSIWALQQGRRGRIAVVVGCAAGELLVYRLFGDGGRFPFETLQLLPGLFFSVIGLLVTRGVPTARPLRGIFWIYLLALVT